MTEVKNIAKVHKPHMFGLSECELHNYGGNFDEKILKIPGYTTIFPRSWAASKYARVIVYIRSSLYFEQIEDLQDEHVQSMWLKATGSTLMQWVTQCVIRKGI